MALQLLKSEPAPQESELSMAANPQPIPSPAPPQRLKQIELPAYEIMTVHEVAEYLRVTPRTVTNMANQGVIPGKQIGKLWRFSRKTILSMM
jgi:excisionase family DNA binding protein